MSYKGDRLNIKMLAYLHVDRREESLAAFDLLRP